MMKRKRISSTAGSSRPSIRRGVGRLSLGGLFALLLLLTSCFGGKTSTADGGELTQTQKLKRKAIAEKYKAIIDAIYMQDRASK